MFLKESQNLHLAKRVIDAIDNLASGRGVEGDLLVCAAPHHCRRCTDRLGIPDFSLAESLSCGMLAETQKWLATAAGRARRCDELDAERFRDGNSIK
jgi:hypothetical protein